MTKKIIDKKTWLAISKKTKTNYKIKKNKIGSQKTNNKKKQN